MSDSENKKIASSDGGYISKDFSFAACAKWVAVLGIPIAIALVPPTEVLTQKIIYYFAITAWAVLSWILGTMPEIVVGFTLPALFIFAGVATPQAAFSPWFSNVPWIGFGGLIFGTALMQTGLARRIAYKCIILAGGTYKRTAIGLMLAGLIIAPIVPSVIGKIAIFSVIGIAICQALYLKPKSNAAAGIMMACFLAVGGPKLSYLTGAADNPLAIGLLTKATGIVVTWGEFAMHNAVIGILYSVLSLVILFIMIKPEKEFESSDIIMERYKELGPMTAMEKRAGLILAAAIIMMATDFWHKIDLGILMIMLSAVLFIPRVGVLTGEHLNKANFSMMFFIAGAMSIGTIAGQTGAVKIMAQAMLPLLHGTELYTFMAVYVFGILIKFFLTPLAATAMFTTPIVEIAQQLGVNPLGLIYVFKYGIDQYLFPYEYAVLLYIYSFGYMSMKHVVRVMLPRIITTAVFLALVAYPYWHWLGLIK